MKNNKMTLNNVELFSNPTNEFGGNLFNIAIEAIDCELSKVRDSHKEINIYMTWLLHSFMVNDGAIDIKRSLSHDERAKLIQLLGIYMNEMKQECLDIDYRIKHHNEFECCDYFESEHAEFVVMLDDCKYKYTGALFMIKQLRRVSKEQTDQMIEENICIW